MEYFASLKKTIAAALLALAAVLFSSSAYADGAAQHLYLSSNLQRSIEVVCSNGKTYSLNSHEAGVSTIYDTWLLKSNGADLGATYSAPQLIGYKFLGWYRAKSQSPYYTQALPQSLSVYTDLVSTALSFCPTDSYLGTACLFKNAPATHAGFTALYIMKYEEEEYTILFANNSGEAWNEIKEQKVSGGATITLPSVTGLPSGVAFYGWYSDLTYTKKVGNAGAEYQPTESLTLYAKIVRDTYTITFNANGGKNTMSDETMPCGKNATLIKNVFTRAGYTFLGWSTTDSATSATYKDEASVNLSSTKDDEITLYAVWKPRTYTVTFDANGGEVEQSTKTVTYATSYGTLPPPTRIGYSFDGWYTDIEEGSKVTSSTKFTATSNQTLYAYWTPISYTVSFNANGGSGAMDNQKLTYDKSEALTANAFSRTGYTFAGWAKSSSGSVAYQDQVSVKNLQSTSGTYYLYAIWTPIEYTVSFSANGGTVELNSKSVTYDSTYGDLPVPTRTGYAFEGWYNAENVRIYPTTSVRITADQTLYAHWTANSYEVTFKSQETSWSTQISETYGKSYRLPSSTPTRTGYTFAGWYTAASGGSQVTEANTVLITAAQTLYAQWAPLTYAVVFDANGGSGTMNDQILTYGMSEALTANAFTRTGYKFDGWAKSPYGSVSYGDRAEVLNLSSTTQGITLYAHWTALTYTIETEGTACAITAPTTGSFGSELRISWSPASVEGYTVSFESATFEGVDEDLGRYSLSVDANASGAYYTMKDHYYQTLSVKVVYAKTPNHYRVTFNANGGSPSETIEETYDAPYSLPTPPTRAGYTFAGWWTAETGGDEITAETIVKILSNQTLYAHWRYQVAFVKGVADELVTGTMTNITAECGKSFTLPANGFSRIGYRFVGWLSGNTLFADAAEVSSDLPLTEGVAVLTAQWEPIKYKISFDANWFTPGTLQTPILTNVVEKSYAVECKLPPWNPVNTLAEKFLGWASSPTGDIIVEDGGTLTEELSDGDDVRLYAIWQMPDMTLSYAVGCTNLVLKSKSSRNSSLGISMKEWSRCETNSGIQSGSIERDKGVDKTDMLLVYSELTVNLNKQPGRLTFTWKTRTAEDGVCAFYVDAAPQVIATTEEKTYVYTNTVADRAVVLSWRAYGGLVHNPTPSNLVITSLKWEPFGEHPEPTEDNRPVITSDFSFATSPDFDYVIKCATTLANGGDWTQYGDVITGDGKEVRLPIPPLGDAAGEAPRGTDVGARFFKVEVIQRGSK